MLDMRTIIIIVLTLGMLAPGCTWIIESAPAGDHAQAPPDCPVTSPNGRTPVNEMPAPFSHHGNDALITALWPNGVVVIEPSMVMSDGTLGMKWPWWREVVGPLAIEGERIDASAPLLGSQIPDGYGDSGFQASGLLFPTEGCWQVTGRVGEESLTFVTWVMLKD